MPIALVILQMLPMVMDIITKLDNIISKRGQGTLKTETVNKLVEKALLADPTVPNENIPEIMVVVTEQTKDLVTAFKEAGIFDAGIDTKLNA